MKKTIHKILIAVAIILVIAEILGFAGILKFYSNPSTANEPNLKLDSKMVVSNLKEPRHGDFVCYKFEDNMLGKHIRVHRLIAKAYDTLEIRNGIVYINGKNMDKNLNLKHIYKLTKLEFESIKDSDQITEDSYTHQTDDNSILILLEDVFAVSNGFTNHRYVEPKEKLNEDIAGIFKQNWNKDNFGPIRIPKDKIFVLGDNRDNSIDSRIIGFIDQAQIVGMVIK